ncbi:MAG: hypothetical protein LBN42_00580 [Oscillospiraceae bacterium]|jgi:hypothetical protein|nr:hypothetical protein [Oscillospiraceae bacterium]
MNAEQVIDFSQRTLVSTHNISNLVRTIFGEKVCVKFDGTGINLTAENVSTIPKERIQLAEEKLAEEIAEDEEDAELIALAEERLGKYGSDEEMLKHTISYEELLLHLGITQEDVDNAEDLEIG